ncbi:hypothetical protein SEA_VERSE_44 [Streptomyces phage Verse]|uniref:Uncharacterized protein n=2 Tax=Streptomyces phage Amela TaxID=1673877 RepID=A0A0K1YA90_9CAUD|nr:hypothetical protein AVT29_gp44 [Streptomyces phage Amela]AKY03799.1 hypothetical protein SEA_AMELA_44 [Streptomyces phage Amela]AKY03874.1 hypothetical protein SEA_VERSE_44 [Streptomyces phage Verse]
MNFIEIEETTEVATPTTDWSWYEPGNEIDKVISRAARHIANKYDDTKTTEFEDAYQDGLVFVATRRNLRAAFGEPGLLYSRLVQDLTDKNKQSATKRSHSRMTSYEANLTKLEGLGV